MSVIFGTVFAALPSISPHVLLGIRLSLLLVMGVLIRNLWVLHKELREIQKHRRERYKHIREYNQMLGVPLQSLTGNLSNLGAQVHHFRMLLKNVWQRRLRCAERAHRDNDLLMANINPRPKDLNLSHGHNISSLPNICIRPYSAAFADNGI